jgi:hypothetical protein
MSVCEKCWRDASQRALLLGGFVSEHYRDLLLEREKRPCSKAERDGVDGGHDKPSTAAPPSKSKSEGEITSPVTKETR